VGKLSLFPNVFGPWAINLFPYMEDEIIILKEEKNINIFNIKTSIDPY
jgi:hypothetical protein